MEGVNISFNVSHDDTLPCPGDGNNRSSVTNIYNIHSSNVQIVSGKHSTGVMQVTNFDSYHGREKLLLKSFQEMKDVFVETQPYLTARELFLKRHYMILIGTSGDGKSFIAKKLIHEKILEGYRLKDINSGQDLRTLVECNKRILLLDDAFPGDNPNTQFLISEMEDFIDENKLIDNSNYIIITSRARPFSEVKKASMSWLLDDECIVDLQKIELTKNEKRNIIEKHIQKFKPQENENPAIKSMIEEIINVDCIGFPNYAYFFVRNDKWFQKGVAFFRNSNKIIQEEIETLEQSNPDIYLFLVYLLLKGGEITRSSLEDCQSDENVIQILEKIKSYPRTEYCKVLNKALEKVEYAYVSRVRLTGTITFRHDRIVEAVCLSFSKILPREAIRNVPFDFIAKRVRTMEYKTDLQDMIVIECDRYKDLAERFEDELKLGNVKSVCEHPSAADQKFVNVFINRLCNGSEILFLIQVTERAYGSTLDGSLLYWSASCGAEYLCKQILECGIYSKVKDEFWVRTQASAALVPSCWYGFAFKVIEKLLDLGADINSSIHMSRCFQTHTSNFPVVHEAKGWTPIQATICGPNENKANLVEYLIQHGCRFQEKKKMVRPLIQAVQQENKHLVNVLLKNGVNIHAVNMRNKSAIQFAVELNLIEIAELILKQINGPLPFVQPRSMDMMMLLANNGHMNLNMKDDEGKGLLHCIEDPNLIDYLLKANKDLSVDLCDGHGRTPLYYAKTDSMVQCLLKHGAPLSCVNNHTHDTFFHVQHNPVIVQNVLEKLNIEEKSQILNKRNKAGMTAIFTSPNVFRILLENNADVNIKCSYSPEKETPEAVVNTTIDKKRQLKREKSEIVAEYINKICSSTVYSSKSNTTSVVSESNPEEMENTEDSENQSEDLEHYLNTDITVVMKLISNGRLSLDKLELALKYGYDFTMRDANGRNLLHHLLSSHTHTKGISLLIETFLTHANSKLTEDEFSEFLDNRDSYGKTPLYLACCCSKLNKLKAERLHVIVSLLKFGADPNVSNNNTEKPVNALMKCRCCLKSDIFEQLIIHEELNEIKETGSRIVKEICRSCSALLYHSAMPESMITDYVKIIKYLFSKCLVSMICSIKYLFDRNTDPNIPFLILQEQLYELDDNVKDEIWRLCCETHANDVMCRLILQPLMRGPQEDYTFHLSTSDFQDIFKFFVRMLKLDVLEITLKLINNFDIHQLEEDLVVWTIDNAQEGIKSKVLCFLLERDVNFCKISAINHCIESSDDAYVTIECLKTLEEHGATLSMGSPLIQALKAGYKRPKVIEYLLTHKEIDLNQQDEANHSVFYCFLEYFAKDVHENVALPMLKVLLNRTPVLTTFEKGDNLLTVALKCKKLSESFVIEIMERLKDTSCINLVDDKNVTPLQSVLLYYHYNRENPELKIVKQIVKFGGKTEKEHKDYMGRNCLHLLVSRMKIDTLKILLYILEKDQDDLIETINAIDNEGKSVLHHACTVCTSDYNYYTSLRISVVRVLLMKGADINILDINKQTVLHLLIQRCNNMSQQDKYTLLNPIIELINLLLKHGIDQSIVDKYGKTAIEYMTDDSIGLRGLLKGDVPPEKLITLPDT